MPPLDLITTLAPHALQALIAVSQINSGSYNPAGVRATAEFFAQLYAPLGAAVEYIDLPAYSVTNDQGQRTERSIGPALRLRQRPTAPIQIFFCGHLDTVFAADSPFQTVRQIDADTLNGPGVADLKGGLVALFMALMVLESSPNRDRIGYTVLMNPDEEIGSKSSAPLLLDAAKTHDFGLIYEPAYANGNLASARKGSGNFDIVIHGRSAHAGRDFAHGRNAIAALSELTATLFALNGLRDGVTINPGYIKGGGALNVVPDLAVLKFNVRTSTPADECWMHEQIDALLCKINLRDGFSSALHGGFTRPPKLISPQTQKLMTWVQECGTLLGLNLEFAPTGGCCDGNNLAAYGLANVDNMGVVGGDIHSDKEWMRISSLSERAKLTAVLLLELADGRRHWN